MSAAYAQEPDLRALLAITRCVRVIQHTEVQACAPLLPAERDGHARLHSSTPRGLAGDAEPLHRYSVANHREAARKPPLAATAATTMGRGTRAPAEPAREGNRPAWTPATRYLAGVLAPSLPTHHPPLAPPTADWCLPSSDSEIDAVAEEFSLTDISRDDADSAWRARGSEKSSLGSATGWYASSHRNDHASGRQEPRAHTASTAPPLSHAPPPPPPPQRKEAAVQQGRPSVWESREPRRLSPAPLSRSPSAHSSHYSDPRSSYSAFRVPPPAANGVAHVSSSSVSTGTAAAATKGRRAFSLNIGDPVGSQRPSHTASTGTTSRPPHTRNAAQLRGHREAAETDASVDVVVTSAGVTRLREAHTAAPAVPRPVARQRGAPPPWSERSDDASRTATSHGSERSPASMAAVATEVRSDGRRSVVSCESSKHADGSAQEARGAALRTSSRGSRASVVSCTESSPRSTLSTNVRHARRYVQECTQRHPAPVAAAAFTSRSESQFDVSDTRRPVAAAAAAPPTAPPSDASPLSTDTHGAAAATAAGPRRAQETKHQSQPVPLSSPPRVARHAAYTSRTASTSPTQTTRPRLACASPARLSHSSRSSPAPTPPSPSHEVMVDGGGYAEAAGALRAALDRMQRAVRAAGAAPGATAGAAEREQYALMVESAQLLSSSALTRTERETTSPPPFTISPISLSPSQPATSVPAVATAAATIVAAAAPRPGRDVAVPPTSTGAPLLSPPVTTPAHAKDTNSARADNAPRFSAPTQRASIASSSGSAAALSEVCSTPREASASAATSSAASRHEPQPQLQPQQQQRRRTSSLQAPFFSPPTEASPAAQRMEDAGRPSPPPQPPLPSPSSSAQLPRSSPSTRSSGLKSPSAPAATAATTRSTMVTASDAQATVLTTSNSNALSSGLEVRVYVSTTSQPPAGWLQQHGDGSAEPPRASRREETLEDAGDLVRSSYVVADPSQSTERSAPMERTAAPPRHSRGAPSMPPPPPPPSPPPPRLQEPTRPPEAIDTGDDVATEGSRGCSGSRATQEDTWCGERSNSEQRATLPDSAEVSRHESGAVSPPSPHHTTRGDDCASSRQPSTSTVSRGTAPAMPARQWHRYYDYVTPLKPSTSTRLRAGRVAFAQHAATRQGVSSSVSPATPSTPLLAQRGMRRSPQRATATSPPDESSGLQPTASAAATPAEAAAVFPPPTAPESRKETTLSWLSPRVQTFKELSSQAPSSESAAATSAALQEPTFYDALVPPPVQEVVGTNETSSPPTSLPLSSVPLNGQSRSDDEHVRTSSGTHGDGVESVGSFHSGLSLGQRQQQNRHQLHREPGATTSSVRSRGSTSAVGARKRTSPAGASREGGGEAGSDFDWVADEYAEAGLRPVRGSAETTTAAGDESEDSPMDEMLATEGVDLSCPSADDGQGLLQGEAMAGDVSPDRPAAWLRPWSSPTSQSDFTASFASLDVPSPHHRWPAEPVAHGDHGGTKAAGAATTTTLQQMLGSSVSTSTGNPFIDSFASREHTPLALSIDAAAAVAAEATPDDGDVPKVSTFFSEATPIYPRGSVEAEEIVFDSLDDTVGAEVHPAGDTLRAEEAAPSRRRHGVRSSDRTVEDVDDDAVPRDSPAGRAATAVRDAAVRMASSSSPTSSRDGSVKGSSLHSNAPLRTASRSARSTGSTTAAHERVSEASDLTDNDDDDEVGKDAPHSIPARLPSAYAPFPAPVLQKDDHDVFSTLSTLSTASTLPLPPKSLSDVALGLVQPAQLTVLLSSPISASTSDVDKMTEGAGPTHQQQHRAAQDPSSHDTTTVSVTLPPHHRAGADGEACAAVRDGREGTAHLMQEEDDYDEGLLEVYHRQRVLQRRESLMSAAAAESEAEDSVTEPAAAVAEEAALKSVLDTAQTTHQRWGSTSTQPYDADGSSCSPGRGDREGDRFSGQHTDTSGASPSRGRLSDASADADASTDVRVEDSEDSECDTAADAVGGAGTTTRRFVNASTALPRPLRARLAMPAPLAKPPMAPSSSRPRRAVNNAVRSVPAASASDQPERSASSLSDGSGSARRTAPSTSAEDNGLLRHHPASPVDEEGEPTHAADPVEGSDHEEEGDEDDDDNGYCSYGYESDIIDV